MGNLFNALVDAVISLTHWLYGVTVSAGVPSYALAIVMLTVIVKLVLFPLTQKQMVSMRKMQQLQPLIKEIQEKYKNKDPRKMQEKMMALYREHNVNPMSGCLPVLIQMPILIALYRALLNIEFIDVEHAGLFWIESLKGTDPYYVLPVLAGLTTYMQSRLTTSPTDQTQKIMLYTMPILIAWISTTVPAGLVLYWIVFNVLGYLQQFYVNVKTREVEEGLVKGEVHRKNR